METKVKICGITRVDDALHAAEAGAAFLGYIFYAPSKRFIAPRSAKEIVQAVRGKFPSVQHVGVFVDEEPSNISWTRNLVGLDLVQLHGKETAAMCDELAAVGIDVIKALGISDSENHAENYRQYQVPYYLIDTFDATLKGGTGRTFDLSRIPKGISSSRLFIAGGLTPVNVGEMVKLKQPFAVDVSTGVEEGPGLKSSSLVTEFINSVQKADRHLMEKVES